MEVLESQSATSRNCLEQKLLRGIIFRRAWAQVGDILWTTERDMAGACVSVRRGVAWNRTGLWPTVGDSRETRLRAWTGSEPQGLDVIIQQLDVFPGCVPYLLPTANGKV